MGFLDLISKYLLLAVVSLLTLFSICIIAIGAIIAILASGNNNAIDPALTFIPIVIIVVGVVVFFIASFGCCGTIGSTPCLLITYTICMVLTLIPNIYFSVVLNGGLGGALIRTVDTQMDNWVANPDLRIVFMGLEGVAGCCGSTGPDSYYRHNITLPLTCCHTLSAGNITAEDINNIQDISQIELCSRENAYERGCSEVIADILKIAIDVLYYFIIGIIVAQAVGLVCSAYLSWSFKRKNDKKEKLETSYYESGPFPQQVHYSNITGNPPPNNMLWASR